MAFIKSGENFYMFLMNPYMILLRVSTVCHDLDFDPTTESHQMALTLCVGPNDSKIISKIHDLYRIE
jgi:hypothetical protein